jgi:hypothetical protein
MTLRRLPILCPVLALAVAGAVAACGNSVPPPTLTEPPLPTPATSPSLQPTSPSPTTAASNGVTTFESTEYAYTMSTLPGTLLGPWRAAERAWDGRQQIDMDSPQTDRTVVADGGLFFVGAPAPDGLEGFLARFERSVGAVQDCVEGARFKNGITGGQYGLVPSDTPAPVFFAVGIAFRERCDGNTLFARQVLVHDGYGIGAWIASVPGDDDEVVLFHLVEMLAGLYWVAR